MRYPVSRRDFRRGIARPGAVSSSNGLRAVTRAMELIARGPDTLDAAVEGVKIQELDPADNSVGYGGLPNEDAWCSSTGVRRSTSSFTP